MTTCERCEKTMPPMSRRFRCTYCRRLTCRQCSTSGGYGTGQGSARWHTCHDCEKEKRNDRSQETA